MDEVVIEDVEFLFIFIEVELGKMLVDVCVEGYF